MTKKNEYFVGIDGGKSGGIAVLDEDRKLVYCRPIELTHSSKGKTYDVKAIADVFDTFSPCIAILEEAHPMFRDGKKQAFTTGELFGMMQTILILKNIPFEVVRAVTWQKEIFGGKTVKDTKAATIEWCAHRFPGHDFTPTEKSFKPHDGMCDSCAIAMYGVMKR